MAVYLPAGVDRRFILLVTAIALLIVAITLALDYRPSGNLGYRAYGVTVLMVSLVLAVLLPNLWSRLRSKGEKIRRTLTRGPETR
jgi:hypothetical protein